MTLVTRPRSEKGGNDSGASGLRSLNALWKRTRRRLGLKALRDRGVFRVHEALLGEGFEGHQKRALTDTRDPKPGS